MTQQVTHYTQQRWTPQYLELLAGMRARKLRGYLDGTPRPARPGARHVQIYAQGRSGITLLASLLASTGYFSDLGEPLHLFTREVWAPARYLCGLGRMAQSHVVAHEKGSQMVCRRRRDPCTFLRTIAAEG